MTTQPLTDRELADLREWGSGLAVVVGPLEPMKGLVLALLEEHYARGRSLRWCESALATARARADATDLPAVTDADFERYWRVYADARDSAVGSAVKAGIAAVVAAVRSEAHPPVDLSALREAVLAWQDAIPASHSEAAAPMSRTALREARERVFVAAVRLCSPTSRTPADRERLLANAPAVIAMLRAICSDCGGDDVTGDHTEECPKRASDGGGAR